MKLSAATWIYRALIAAYPASFRRRFGRDMLRSFDDRHAAMAHEGRWSNGHFLVRAYLDALAGAAMLRAAAVRDRLLWPDPLITGEPRGRSDMWWQTISTDVRYGLRMFRRAPVFAALAVLALALGIGANTAIFTVVDGVLLRPLPYDHPDRLVEIWTRNSKEHRDHDSVSPLDFLDFQKARAFSSVEAAYGFLIAAPWTTQEGTGQVVVTAVTPGTFALLGREPLMGRAFSDRERQTAVVISYDFWHTRLGADPGVIGRVLDIQYQPRTVVGVMPKDFVFPYQAMLGPTGFARAQDVDAWLPLELVDPRRFVRSTGTMPLSRGIRMLTVVGRLAPDATVEQAQAELNAMTSQLAAAEPATNAGIGANVVPVHEQAVGSTRTALMVLLGGVGLVLLMACVNLANMLLARSTARQKEMAIRAALGAGRRRLVVQTLVESILLGVAGGAVGLGVLVFSLRAVLALAPADIPRIDDVHVDAAMFLFAAVLSMLTGIVIGLIPALSASRADVNRSLKQSSRGATAGRFQQRARGGLIVAEAALAVVLTVGAGLLLRSFLQLMAVDPGFRSARVLTLQITVPPAYQSVDERRVMYETLRSELSSIPGVTAVGGTTRLPLGSTNVSTKIVVEGRSALPSEWPEVEFRRAVFDYFGAMSIPILRGRGFTADDGPGRPPVCVVNETMARQMFTGEDPIGTRIKFGSTDGPWVTIVGVIGDIRHDALSARPSPEVYVYYLQNPPTNPFLVLRTSVEPGSLTAAVRARLLAVDKNIATNDVKPMDVILSESVARQRFVLVIVGAFGVLALLMAAAGVYGVMALVVSERAPEMAIRLALGASPSSVLGLVIRHGVGLAAAGAAAGVALSAAIAPVIRSQLFRVRPEDPVTLTAVPVLVVVIALLACYVPARRIMRVDPVRALRVE